MGAHNTLSFIASAGHLGLAVLVLLRRSDSAVSRPLAVLCVNLFTWNFATMAYRVSRVPEWHFIDVMASPWTPSLMLHVVLAFVGRLRELGRWLILAYVPGAALSLSGASAFFTDRGVLWTNSSAWAVVFLCLGLPVVIAALYLLSRHVQACPPGAERRRSAAMFAAALLGTALGLTDLWDEFIPYVPSLAHLGTFLSTAILALLTLRMHLLEVVYTRSVIATAALVGTLGVGAHILASDLWGPTTAMVILATALVSTAAVVLARNALRSAKTRAERGRQLALLGRFAAQMSHDLRNPLAALKGSVQYLQAEVGAPSDPVTLKQYLDLMADQVQRIQAALDGYQRIARVERQPSRVDLNLAVRRVLALQPFAAGQIRIETTLDPSLPPVLLDAELFAPALENVIQNAIEATPPLGSIVVSTSLFADRVRVTVEDSGAGMDARLVERAADEFFTTKSAGSGLGLPFAKRVVEAHAGQLRIDSRPGAGTKVTFDLPIRREALPSAHPVGLSEAR